MTRLGEGISYGTVQGEVVRREKGEDGGGGGGGIKKGKERAQGGVLWSDWTSPGVEKGFQKGGGGPSHC